MPLFACPLHTSANCFSFYFRVHRKTFTFVSVAEAAIKVFGLNFCMHFKHTIGMCRPNIRFPFFLSPCAPLGGYVYSFFILLIFQFEKFGSVFSVLSAFRLKFSMRQIKNFPVPSCINFCSPLHFSVAFLTFLGHIRRSLVAFRIHFPTEWHRDKPHKVNVGIQWVTGTPIEFATVSIKANFSNLFHSSKL